MSLLYITASPSEDDICYEWLDVTYQLRVLSGITSYTVYQYHQLGVF